MKKKRLTKNDRLAIRMRSRKVKPSKKVEHDPQYLKFRSHLKKTLQNLA